MFGTRGADSYNERTTLPWRCIRRAPMIYIQSSNKILPLCVEIPYVEPGGLFLCNASPKHKAQSDFSFL